MSRFIFEEDTRSNIRVRAKVFVDIERYSYRQGTRVAVVNFSDEYQDVSLKSIVLDIWKVKSNCVTLNGKIQQDVLEDIVNYLNKFVNRSMLHIDTYDMNLEQPIILTNCRITNYKFFERI